MMDSYNKYYEKQARLMDPEITQANLERVRQYQIFLYEALPFPWLVTNPPLPLIRKPQDVAYWKYRPEDGIRIPLDASRNPILAISFATPTPTTPTATATPTAPTTATSTATAWNPVKFLSSQTLLSDSEILCGENFQSQCDVVLGTIPKLSFNPNNNHFSKKMMALEHLGPTLDPSWKILFVFSDNLREFYHRYHPQLSNRILVSHNSDAEFTLEMVPYLKFVGHQYCQNVVFDPVAVGCASQLTPIPIGIQNRQWLNHSIFHLVRRTTVPKTKHIYFNFSLGTHPSRRECYQTLKDRLTWNTVKPSWEYFQELQRHRYAICPRGNGLDTHRFWECIYLDVIPIMIRKDALHIPGFFPIVWLDKWDDLDPDHLPTEFAV